ncbi:MAG: hypothetical protein Q6358_13975 [Candidatus Brocadiales bacterium]|nr:hypothetical protein [Candidatus Brocadiales bacterium]
MAQEGGQQPTPGNTTGFSHPSSYVRCKTLLSIFPIFSMEDA